MTTHSAGTSDGVESSGPPSEVEAPGSSNEIESSESTDWTDSYWPYAGLAGILAGALRPLVTTGSEALGLPVGSVAPLLPTDIALWWVIHLAYGFAFGALFAVLVWRAPLRNYAARLSTGAVLGVTFGFGLWVVNVALVWNVVLAELIYVTNPPSAFTLDPLIGHLGYGLALGILYPIVRRLASDFQ